MQFIEFGNKFSGRIKRFQIFGQAFLTDPKLFEHQLATQKAEKYFAKERSEISAVSKTIEALGNQRSSHVVNVCKDDDFSAFQSGQAVGLVGEIAAIRFLVPIPEVVEQRVRFCSLERSHLNVRLYPAGGEIEMVQRVNDLRQTVDYGARLDRERFGFDQVHKD